MSKPARTRKSGCLDAPLALIFLIILLTATPDARTLLRRRRR